MNSKKCNNENNSSDWTKTAEFGAAGCDSAGVYNELQQALFDYAGSKGELGRRWRELKELYKDVEDADINAELTADLVGDYLFTDEAFVQRLSAQNQNVFQRLWEEIKYLCRCATAGSKELKELERVKRLFEKAYREGSTVTPDMKYSLNIKHTDGSVEVLADARRLTNEQVINYLHQAQSGKLKWDTYIPVRKDTPQVIIDTLAQIGENIENRSLVMQVRKVQQAMTASKSGRRAGKYGSNVRGHSLSAEQIVEIVNNLNNPSTVVYQTNRQDSRGNPLPNNVAVFVEYNNNGTEGVAVIEFDSSINPESIGTEFGDTSYHTVVTVFEPDVERNGMDFDYAEELLSNPDNIELEIERRQPEGSAIGKNHPNTSIELPSNISISQAGVNIKDDGYGNTYSLSDTGKQYDNGVALEAEASYPEELAPVRGDLGSAPPVSREELAPVGENARRNDGSEAQEAEAPAGDSLTQAQEEILQMPEENPYAEKLVAKWENSRAEAENLERLREEALASYDRKIFIAPTLFVLYNENKKPLAWAPILS